MGFLISYIQSMHYFVPWTLCVWLLSRCITTLSLFHLLACICSIMCVTGVLIEIQAIKGTGTVSSFVSIDASMYVVSDCIYFSMYLGLRIYQNNEKIPNNL